MPRSLRSRAFAFTINNYTEDEYEAVKDYGTNDARYMCMGREIGESGTPHLQGYVAFRNPRSTRSTCSNLGGRAHVEPARGTAEENRTYCSKDNQFWEIGEIPENPGGSSLEDRIARNNRIVQAASIGELVSDGTISVYMVNSVQRARLILSSEGAPIGSDDVRGIWYYGDPGVGKSHKVRADEPDLYLKQQNKWWDGYSNEEAILLDDFDCKVLSHYIKIWADKYPFYGEVKGGTVSTKYQRFYITSNYHPDELWNEDQQLLNAIKRRFNIIRITRLGM